MTETAIAILILAGSLYMLIAALGIVKLRDVYMRMHAITKAASLGAILMLASVSLIYTQWIVWVEALMVVVFIIITAPIASHMIAKAAHKGGNPKGPGYIMDELEGVDNEGVEE